MKKTLFMSVLLLSISSFVWAVDTDTQLEDTIKNQTTEQIQQTAQTLKESIKFEKFNSCSDMEKVLTDFAQYYSGTNRYFGGGYLDGGLMVDVATSTESANAVASDTAGAGQKTTSSSTDFSQTNVQVKGVDEPDIIKTDGKYIYYYNEKEKKVFILKSPLDIATSSIDLSTAQVLKAIKIPDEFNSVNLFIYKNKLVILANRYTQMAYKSSVQEYSILDNYSRTSIIVYDISDINNLKLQKFIDTNGSLNDARLIDNNLYFVSQTYLNLWNYRRPIMINGVETKRSALTASDVLPKTVEITATTQTSKQNFTGGYNANVSQIDCENEMMYLLPSKETVQKYNINPSMAIVSHIDLNDIEKKVEKKILFGDVSQLHMTTDSLYIANNFWVGYNFSCPMGSYCIMPYFRGTENTLIHKFDLNSNSTLSYNNSNIIPGSPLNQYSMSEDDNGNFRILTNTWWPNLNTHLFVLSKDLKLAGSLMNIKDEEQFKASRFIGNMLYLVTFKQIDPLFAIDISNTSKPKMIGELEIPGYSTYLHPYTNMTGGIQYLIGLGYDTGTGSWGGTVNSGIKLDLYKVDFNNKNASGNIAISQVYTKTLGGQGSYTEALENPRMFVWNEAKKLLIMPLFLSDQFKTKTCTTGIPGYENCYDSYMNVSNFAGLKGFNIDLNNGITESFSKDYLNTFSGSRDTGNYGYPYSEWEFRNMMYRVGYAGDAIYGINNLFGDFFLPSDVSKSQTVSFK